MSNGSAILVLRSNDAFSARLRETGREVINLELITIKPIDDTTEIDRELEEVENFDGLFFTSPSAATAFLSAMKRTGRVLSACPYVLGERTKTIFQDAGISVNFAAGANTAAEMIAAFGEAEFAGKRLLFVRGDRSMRTIPELLAGKAEVEEMVVYRTLDRPPDAELASDLSERLRSGEIGWACFFSPSAIDVFCRVFKTAELGSVRIAAIGSTTALKAREGGLNMGFVSQRARAVDFANELIEHIKNS